jgi:hypothetical protein
LEDYHAASLRFRCGVVQNGTLRELLMGMPQARKAAATAVFLLLYGSITTAQMVRPLAPSASPNTTTTGVVSTSARSAHGIIHGTAVDRDSLPMPHATVRLRNLASGEIEKTSTVDREGEFTFVVQPEVPYVVEVADQQGQVLAVGNVVTTEPGEVAGSIVSVPSTPPSAGLLSNSTGSVISAASGAGVIPVRSQSEPPPASPDK